MVEQLSYKQRVTGSNPVRAINLWECRLMDGHRSSKSTDVGSSPTTPAKYGSVA